MTVIITLPYPQLAFFRCFHNNAITPPDYPQLAFNPTRRRIRKISVVRANVIDKEHEVFKPSFDEYLKAMETVKTRRNKRKTLTTQTQLPPASEIEQGEVKKTWVRKNLDFKEGGLGAKGSRLEGVRRNADANFEFRERSFDMKRVSKDEGVERVMSNVNQGEVVTKKWTRRKPDFKDGQIGTEFREQRVPDSNLDEVVKRWTRKKTDGKEVEMGLRSYERSSISSKKYVKKPSRKSGNDSYDDVEIERAAFKSLEEFPDVCDQPRVSRVDMDERIQKLAKSLNGAPIDTPEWNFSKMMRSAKIRFADFSIIRLIQILGNYGNWRQVLQVIEWMQARERFKSNRIRNIYTAALDALGKARRPVEALNMFHTMQQQMASYPDIVAYHCIAVTLGQAGHMRELFHVIDTMRSPPKKKLATGVLQKWDPRLEPDIIVYNAMLNACVRQKNLEGAFWVLQQLKQQGLQPNSITYGLVMEVMLACEKYNLVHEFFKKMRKSFIPNSLTYKVLVNTLWKEGKIDEAILTVKEMEKRGIIGSAALYYDLARCLCSAGRHVEAIVQIEKICKVANKPLVVTYTGLIQASLDSGKIESVTYIFKHMHKFCSPNLVTYNIMLKGYLDHHMFDEAKQLFYKLLENGNNVTSKVDYRQVVLPDIHTFNLMLDACLVNQKWDDLEFVYMKMLQHGYYFNAKRHMTIILEACKAGKVNLLETTWKHLIEGDQIPPPPLVQEMFCMKLKQENYDAAFSCLICLPSTESHKYSRISWVTRFKDDPKLFREETFLRAIDRVNTLSIGNEEPNVILLNLMKSCKETLNQLKVEEFVML
ncbi:pentatricopeptide repeat-containing protein At1g30610, chloroplastic-like [Bidens hawaiensis]|uniref:pentatricopeptide repeat-containing protein At1g30610, chloroplastic-like n=1 Tax=Bidens hawaiensis TaxID=980011 RepID=UPI00404AB7AF